MRDDFIDHTQSYKVFRSEMTVIIISPEKQRYLKLTYESYYTYYIKSFKKIGILIGRCEMHVYYKLPFSFCIYNYIFLMHHIKACETMSALYTRFSKIMKVMKSEIIELRGSFRVNLYHFLKLSLSLFPFLIYWPFWTVLEKK